MRIRGNFDWRKRRVGVGQINEEKKKKEKRIKKQNYIESLPGRKHGTANILKMAENEGKNDVMKK